MQTLTSGWSSGVGAYGSGHGTQQGYQWQDAGMDPWQYELGKRGLDMQKYQADLGANTAMYHDQMGQQRFNSIFPLLRDQLGNWRSMVGGQSGPGPTINAGPIWNDQQIQQKVNSQKAANDQALASRQRQNASEMGGRGFGGNSPLLAALNQSAWNQNLAQNTANEREVRMNMAQANAQYQQQGQLAREQQYADRMREDIQRRQQAMGYQTALLSALAGLV